MRSRHGVNIEHVLPGMHWLTATHAGAHSHETRSAYRKAIKTERSAVICILCAKVLSTFTHSLIHSALTQLYRRLDQAGYLAARALNKDTHPPPKPPAQAYRSELRVRRWLLGEAPDPLPLHPRDLS